MTDRAGRKSSRTETHTLGDEAENIRQAVSLMWGPAFSASGMSDVFLNWSERASEQVKTNRRVAEAAKALAQRQGKLFVEFAQSLEMEVPAETTAAKVPGLKIKTGKLDHLFDEAADIMRDASHLFAEAQIETLNLMRPRSIEGKTFSLSAVAESQDAA